MDDKQVQINRGEQVLYNIYNRYPVVFERGQGVYLYDSENKEYLDFGAGIAVAGLGYHDPDFSSTLKNQVDLLLHTSNLFYNQPSIDAAEKLLAVSEMEKVFFTNSGTEAIEGAFKIAKRYGFNRDGHHGHEVVAMKQSFHGRSLGALSLTGNDHYQEPFKPLIPGVKFACFNDLDSVKALVSEKTIAIIMETIQGEGGIYPATNDFLVGIKEICEKNDILLILDEIQCGMGRTGSMFAWQQYGVKPDVMTIAKALGNGVPIGAFLTQGKASSAMSAGDHGTTYGGNPFVCAAASKVLDLYQERNIINHVIEMGDYLAAQLIKLTERYDVITAERGKGLMRGLEFKVPVAPLIKHALIEEQLVLIGAGSQVVRFVPPLIIEPEHIDLMINKLIRSIEASLIF